MPWVFPEPPSANVYWRSNRGRTHVSDEGVAYREAVAWRLRAFRLPPAPSVPVAVTIRWHRGRKSGDLDNRIKPLLDALKGFAFVDDKQVVEIHASRHEDKRNPRVEVEVRKAA